MNRPRYNIFHAEDGSPIPLEEALKKHGQASVQHALLQWLFYEYASTIRLRGYPPKVFLSYHRASKQNIEIVSFLADRLRMNGFDVLFDEDDLVEDSLNLGVAKFVSRLSECHIFVPIITDGYLDDNSPTTLRWWLHEESQQGINLQQQGILEIVCLWLANRPPPTQPTTWYFGHVPVIDLRQFDLAALDSRLTYKGPRLSESERGEFTELITRFESTLSQQQVAAAKRVLEQAPDGIKELEEYHLMKIQYCASIGSNAINEPLAKLENAPNIYPPNRLKLVRALFEIDDCKVLLRTAWPLLRFSRASNLPRIHLMMGYSLRDLGHPISAINHLSRSLQLGEDEAENWRCGMLNEIGSIYLEIGHAQEARSFLELACKIDETDWQPVYNLVRCLSLLGDTKGAIELRNLAIQKYPAAFKKFVFNDPVLLRGLSHAVITLDNDKDVTCNICKARFPYAEGSLLCGACGTSNHRGPCRACGYTEFNPNVWRDERFQKLCPVCRKGTLGE